MRRKIVAAAVVLLVGAAAAGLWLGFGGAGERGDAADAAEGAPVAARRGDLVEVASASGTVEPDVQVEVKSRASGEVIERAGGSGVGSSVKRSTSTMLKTCSWPNGLTSHPVTLVCIANIWSQYRMGAHGPSVRRRMWPAVAFSRYSSKLWA